LLELDVLSEISVRILENRLSPWAFNKIYRRARRNSELYRERLVHAAIKKGHLSISKDIINGDLNRGGGWKWRKLKREIRRCEAEGRAFDWGNPKTREPEHA
jgi:hypothetical protein